MAPETERANNKSKRLTFYERPGNDLLEILFMGPLIAQCCFDARRLNVFHFSALLLPFVAAPFFSESGVQHIVIE